MSAKSLYLIGGGMIAGSLVSLNAVLAKVTVSQCLTVTLTGAVIVLTGYLRRNRSR